MQLDHALVQAFFRRQMFSELGGELAVIRGVVLLEDKVMAEGEIKVYKEKGNGGA